MTAPREPLLQKVRQWASFAEEDLRLAHHAMGMSQPVPYRLVAYHAQQCAEKYLKAYLVFREIDFPFTHNISTLLELCEPIAAWATDLQDAEMLTVYAVTARYPGMEEQVNADEANEAIALASQIRDTIRPFLDRGGVDLDQEDD